MRLEQDRLGQIKNYVYMSSAALLFLTWCLSLAALTQGGGVDGRLAWVFGLCFLTIPLLIYQSLTPIWSRTARFSNPHAHCIVDGLLSIFWSSAWISLTSYVVSGKSAGSNDKKSGCDNFAHGSAAKCRISEADIIFSVVLMLCFLATSFFSFKVLMEYRRTGMAPNTAYLAGGTVNKSDVGYPQSTGMGYKEDDEAFDSRLDVDEDRRRGSAYSFEATRLHGGVLDGRYGGLGASAPYGRYESVPAREHEHEHDHEDRGRPTSFGGPLGGNRV